MDTALKPSDTAMGFPGNWRTSRLLPVAVIVVSLVILAGTILLVRHQLRARIREQIIARDGVVLHDVAALPQYEGGAEDLGLESLEDPANQLTLMLRISRLRGVLAARLYDADGGFSQSFPPNVEEAQLLPRQLEVLRTLKPASGFHPAMPLSNMWVSLEPPAGRVSETAPVLEVNIPLHEPGEERLLGVAQFLINGAGISAEFERLDSYLNHQATLYFGVGGSLLTWVIGFAFYHLRKAARLLEQRSLDLLQANRELLMTAKTSAVGAVTSHLIHELKNPLSGLHQFVVAGAQQGAPPAGSEDWNDAVAAARRMQSTIQEIVALLREEQSSTHYTLLLSETVDVVIQRLSPQARDKDVELSSEGVHDRGLPNRMASLVVLILVNLGANGIQSSPMRGRVCFRYDGSVDGGEFEVQDSGPGFERSDSDRLFHPRPSTHAGGTGLGLAICKQLANHLGATLELKQGHEAGCLFVLRLPPNRATG